MLLSGHSGGFSDSLQPYLDTKKYHHSSSNPLTLVESWSRRLGDPPWWQERDVGQRRRGGTSQQW